MSEANKRAVWVKDVERPPSDSVLEFGPASIYRMDPPIDGYGHIYMSASNVIGRPECYAFGADADGKVLDWCELHCSQRGTLDHDDVLCNAGYVAIGRPS